LAVGGTASDRRDSGGIAAHVAAGERLDLPEEGFDRPRLSCGRRWQFGAAPDVVAPELAHVRPCPALRGGVVRGEITPWE
jgi:hypothetical protein